jgi:hypothetical protein
MHASLWSFRGDPDELLERFDAVLADAPVTSIVAMLVLRTPDGVLVVDTCPSREAYESFRDGEWFAGLLQKHGLPRPLMQDYAVERTVLSGELARA